MKILVTLALLALWICVQGETVNGLVSSPSEIAKWKGGKNIFTILPTEGPEQSPAVGITNSDPKEDKLAFYYFEAADVVGKTVTVTCEIKANEVVRQDKNYQGVKFQLLTISTDGKVTYVEQLTGSFRTGTYNWKGAKLTAKIPVDAKQVRLQIGLQGASGSVFFANMDCKIEDENAE